MEKDLDIIKCTRIKNYEKIKDLGEGAFGKTVLVKDPSLDQLLVIKKYCCKDPNNSDLFYENFKKEIKLMYEVYHPSIVRIHNAYLYDSSKAGFIIMQYIDGKPIDEVFPEIVKDDQNFSFHFIDSLFERLIDAFDYLEKKHIIHRDIRETNILVACDFIDYIPYIIDFGFGKIIAAQTLPHDSDRSIINHTNIDFFPEEYETGTYSSLTDMFYLGELFNRLIRINQAEQLFSYNNILKKMIQKKPKDRFDSFEKIKLEISKQEFTVTDKERKIVSPVIDIFSYHLLQIEERPKTYSLDEFISNVNSLYEETIYTSTIDRADIIRLVLKNDFTLDDYNYEIQHMDYENFYHYFINLDKKAKALLYNNIRHKILNKPYSEPVPF